MAEGTAEFKYQEPARLALGQKIYEQYKNGKEKGDAGNAVSLLSDAMTVLRQLGTVGLDVWIDTDSSKRQFIRRALEAEATELAASLKARQQDADTSWAEIENLMQVLRWAKYWAKTHEEEDDSMTEKND
uniref:hypothetical protein n=1 Tax=Candidatus Electrothrix sp. TaxID=2170559 RepID=UPI004055BDB6